MTKKRKSLDDPAAMGFVFGTQPVADTEPLPASPPKPQEVLTPQPLSPQASSARPSVMQQLMESMEASTKESTVRLTVDMPESMHKKLSLLSVQSGKKKAVIVRMLLTEALENLSE